jgi:hypothetical protein
MKNSQELENLEEKKETIEDNIIPVIAETEITEPYPSEPNTLLDMTEKKKTKYIFMALMILAGMIIGGITAHLISKEDVITYEPNTLVSNTSLNRVQMGSGEVFYYDNQDSTYIFDNEVVPKKYTPILNKVFLHGVDLGQDSEKRFLVASEDNIEKVINRVTYRELSNVNPNLGLIGVDSTGKNILIHKDSINNFTNAYNSNLGGHILIKQQ